MKTANKHSAKKALLTSVLALVLCFAMLLGTTFAWFTDTASTSVNTIQAGKLDIALEMKEGDDWVSAEGKTLSFSGLRLIRLTRPFCGSPAVLTPCLNCALSITATWL